MGFCDDQIRRLEPLWSRMLEHPFLLETRDGTLADGRFARWLRQDYLFVGAAVPFLGVLLSRAPGDHRPHHSRAIRALEEELALFRERAEALGISLDDVIPSLVNHAYVQYLLATGHRDSYPEAYTVLYAAERSYHDSWKVVREGLDADSPWYPFVDNWAGDAFAGYVESLETRLDALAASAGDDLLGRMATHFERTVRYEIAFWEMAYTGAGWPGIPPGDDELAPAAPTGPGRGPP